MNACIGVIGLLRTLNRMTFAIPRAAAASLVGLLLLCGCAVSVADSEGHPRAVETLAATGGAAALSLADLTPRVDEAFNDRPGHDCVLQPEEVEPKVCEFGDTASDFVVVLVGDSKLHQWRPALEAIATEQGWRLVEIVKSACAFTAAMTVYEDSAWTECHDWGQKTLDVVLEMEPDLVIVSQRRSAAMPGDDPAITTAESMVDGLVTYWSRLTRAGIQVVALLDNPAPTGHVPKCLEQHPDDFGACAFPVAEGVDRSATPTQLAAAQRVPDVEVLDMSDVVCPDGHCHPVQGDGLLVFRQGSHLTNTFVMTHADTLGQRLLAVLR